MIEDYSLYHSKVACGQYHSAFIGVAETETTNVKKQIQRLYVWGQNDEGQLSDKIMDGQKSFQKKIDTPTQIQLKFGQREYEAMSVESGPSYNLIIGQINLEYEKNHNSSNKRSMQKQKWQHKQPLIMPDDHERYKRYSSETKTIVEKIRRVLRQHLFAKGTLAVLFERNTDEDGDKGAAAGKKDQDTKMMLGMNKRKGGYSQFYSEDRSAAGVAHQANGGGQAQQVQDQEPSQIFLERQEFLEQLQARQIATIDDCMTLTDVLFDNSNEISLQQLEDFALGFQQDATKLFMYGKCDAKLFSFNKKLPIVNPLVGKQSDSKADQHERQFGFEPSSESSEEDFVAQAKMSIITRPTVVTFPRFCPKIVQVSCGVGHILALTSHHDMYSWGNGEYGALGFGTIQSILHPTNLSIRQNSIKLQIVRVECGSLHSICVSSKRQIFTWGCGKQGRLGHGNEEDILVPTEIVKLSQMRVTQISAGESHCAAITQAGRVYLWGNGSYGRLGTGFEFQQNSPELIDDLTNKEIVRVSCGAFHTLVLSKDGYLYSFGQNKYGKLGLNVRKENTVFRSTHTQIHPYRIIYNANDKNNKIEEEPLTTFRQIIAGYNHSLAVTKHGRVYSWGYSGYSLLGREGVQNIPIAIETGYQTMKKFFVKLPAKDLTIKFERDGGEAQQNINLVNYSTKITKVQCVALGTLVLTDKGEAYYSGDIRYGQLPVEEEKNIDYKIAEDIFKQVNIFKKVIKNIAAGGDHIFAVTQDDKVWAWGRNDSAQLGIGQQQDYVNTPTEVPAFREVAVTKICCGNNYSAAITSANRLMVAGSMEYGKLGLGTNQRSGFAHEFQIVSKLRSVKDIACGPTHMLAIVDRNTSSGCGVFAWGNNQMGQLGTESTESSYSPKEIVLKKSERFDEICAGLDFSLGLARHSRKVYMWGNIKYYGSSTSTQNQMHKAPILIKDLESEKIKHIFCSQTYCYVITENDEIKSWGEWFYERAKEFQNAGLLDQEEDDTDLNQMQDREDLEDQNDGSDDEDSDEDDSNEDSDEDFDYQTSESEESSQGQQRKQEAKRKKNDQTKDFHQITTFPPDRNKQLQDVKMCYLAFGTNHAAAISEEGLLYTWGHNAVQQLGIRKNFDQIDENISKEQRLKELNRVHEADINRVLQSNKQRQNEETFGQAVGEQNQKDEQDEFEDDDEANLVEDTAGIGIVNQPGRVASGAQGHHSRDQDDEPPGKEPSVHGSPRQGTRRADQPLKQVGWSDAPDNVKEEQMEVANPEQIKLIDKLEKPTDSQQVTAIKQPQQKKAVRQVHDFPQVKADKHIRLRHTDNPLEQKQQALQAVLKQEIKRSDEESLFVLDKSINEALAYLLMTLARLPAIDQQRKKLKVMIKNAFLQRISEKPLNVPPVIDFDRMTVSKYNQRNKRRQKKASLQQILNILQLHPCYLLNLYERCDVDRVQILDYLKNIYPSQCFSNQQFGALNPRLDNTPMISREQERVNLLLISFIKHTIKRELSEFRSLEQVDFLGDDSLIGILFYRIFKSQKKNVDTVCSILAHLMNKFISKLQESAEFDGQTTSKTQEEDTRGGKKSKDKGKRSHEDTEGDQYSTKAVAMYDQFLRELINEILSNQVLTQQNANFQLKLDWQKEAERDGYKVPSLRFSSEVNLLIEIIFMELNEMKNKKKAKSGTKEVTHDQVVAQKLFGLIFYRMIRKISSDKENLMLYLYPYLRETKKQILIDEGMDSHGEKYLELCNIVNYFFTDMTLNLSEREGNWNDFDQNISKLRQHKLTDIFKHMKETNNVQPKLLAMKHFEAAMFHSLSPYDFQLKLKKQSLIELFQILVANQQEVTLMSPSSNDQLFRLFGIKKRNDTNNNYNNKNQQQQNASDLGIKEFINSLKTYPDRFTMKIPSRMFVTGSSTNISQCKDCQTVLTDEYVKLESQPIIDQYEPEDKESLISVYCDILRGIPHLDPQKNIMLQLKELNKQLNQTGKGQQISEKINEFRSQLDREIQLIKQSHQEKSEEQDQQISDDFESLKGAKIYDWFNFKSYFNDDEEEKEQIEIKLEGLAFVKIFEDIILTEAQAKINERITHKNISTVLQRRMRTDLKDYMDQTLQNILSNEIFQLKIQLYNVQLGLGNLELRKLTKSTDRVQQMKSILHQQKQQHYSEVLYRVLPDSQKMLLRAIVSKRAKSLIQNRTITEIKIPSLRTMINECKLLIMEDESRDVLIKLLYEQKSRSCICFKKSPMENLLLQFHLSQAEIVEMRKVVKAYQMYKMHVNVAFDSDSLSNQQKVCAFATKISGADDKNKDKKRRGDNKSIKKKGADTREAALQMLSVFNRRTFKDCIEFDLTKLIELINDMLKTRYAYVFNSDKSPEQLLSENIPLM